MQRTNKHVNDVRHFFISWYKVNKLVLGIREKNIIT